VALPSGALKERRRSYLPAPPAPPGPGSSPIAWAELGWTVLRRRARAALTVLDGVAVAAWVVLAVMLLAVIMGSALGAMDVGKLTQRGRAIHPVPAQAPHWEEAPIPRR
jgi:hypothetical protein